MGGENSRPSSLTDETLQLKFGSISLVKVNLALNGKVKTFTNSCPYIHRGQEIPFSHKSTVPSSQTCLKTDFVKIVGTAFTFLFDHRTTSARCHLGDGGER